MASSLWTRSHASFKRACRCYTCLANPSSSAIRRPIDSAGRKWPLRNGLTLFYSTIIATAAAADVKIKHERSNAWDEVIAAAEADVRRGNERMVGEKSYEKVKFPARGMHVAPDSDYAALVNTFRPDRDTEKRQQRHGWTSKKLLRVELNVARMTTKWMLESARQSRAAHPECEDLAGKLASLEDALREIKHRDAVAKQRDAEDVDDLPRLQFPCYQVPSASNSEATKHLNDALLSAFSGYSVGASDWSTLLSRLALALLTSTAPPDIRTFTILIEHMSRAKQYSAVDATIAALIASHIRPNESSCAAILQHMISSNNLKGFREWSAKLDNASSTPLMLAGPWVDVDGSSQGRLKRVGSQIFQSIEFDPRIYEARIGGLLHFEQRKEAMWLYFSMLRKGLEPSLPLMSAFFEHNAKHGNWQRARVVWKQIKSRLNDPTRSTNFDPLGEVGAFQVAYRTCRSHGQFTDMSRVGEEAQGRGIPMSMLEDAELDATHRAAGAEVHTRRSRLLKIAHLSQQHGRAIAESTASVMAARALLEGHSTSIVKRIFDQFQGAKWYETFVRDRPYLHLSEPRKGTRKPKKAKYLAKREKHVLQSPPPSGPVTSIPGETSDLESQSGEEDQAARVLSPQAAVPDEDVQAISHAKGRSKGVVSQHKLWRHVSVSRLAAPETWDASAELVYALRS